jgi:hypothetical protein
MVLWLVLDTRWFVSTAVRCAWSIWVVRIGCARPRRDGRYTPATLQHHGLCECAARTSLLVSGQSLPLSSNEDVYVPRIRVACARWKTLLEATTSTVVLFTQIKARLTRQRVLLATCQSGMVIQPVRTILRVKKGWRASCLGIVFIVVELEAHCSSDNLLEHTSRLCTLMQLLYWAQFASMLRTERCFKTTESYVVTLNQYECPTHISSYVSNPSLLFPPLGRDAIDSAPAADLNTTAFFDIHSEDRCCIHLCVYLYLVSWWSFYCLPSTPVHISTFVPSSPSLRPPLGTAWVNSYQHIPGRVRQDIPAMMHVESWRTSPQATRACTSTFRTSRSLEKHDSCQARAGVPRASPFYTPEYGHMWRPLSPGPVLEATSNGAGLKEMMRRCSLSYVCLSPSHQVRQYGACMQYMLATLNGVDTCGAI